MQSSLFAYSQHASSSYDSALVKHANDCLTRADKNDPGTFDRLVDSYRIEESEKHDPSSVGQNQALGCTYLDEPQSWQTASAVVARGRYHQLKESGHAIEYGDWLRYVLLSLRGPKLIGSCSTCRGQVRSVWTPSGTQDSGSGCVESTAKPCSETTTPESSRRVPLRANRPGGRHKESCGLGSTRALYCQAA